MKHTHLFVLSGLLLVGIIVSGVLAAETTTKERLTCIKADFNKMTKEECEKACPGGPTSTGSTSYAYTCTDFVGEVTFTCQTGDTAYNLTVNGKAHSGTCIFENAEE